MLDADDGLHRSLVPCFCLILGNRLVVTGVGEGVEDAGTISMVYKAFACAVLNNSHAVSTCDDLG